MLIMSPFRENGIEKKKIILYNSKDENVEMRC